MKRDLVIVIILSFLSATVFTVSKSIAAKNSNDWLVEKRYTAIDCRPTTNKSDNSWPYSNDEKNGCSHMGAACTSFISGNKRLSAGRAGNKIHPC